MDNNAQTPVTQPQPEAQPPMQTPEPVKSSLKTMWYVMAVLVVLVLIGGVYMLAKRPNKTVQPTTVIQQPTIQPKLTLPRSKPLGIITNVVTTTSLDAQGNPVSPTSSFSATTKTIYLAVSLNNAKVGTKVEYVRYLNGKYLDKNALKIVIGFTLCRKNKEFLYT